MNISNKKKKLRKLKEKTKPEKQRTGTIDANQFFKPKIVRALRQALNWSKLSSKAIAEGLKITESAVNSMREAQDMAALSNIEEVRAASINEIDSWITQLGFDALPLLVPLNLYRDAGPPPERKWLPQVTSTRSH